MKLSNIFFFLTPLVVLGNPVAIADAEPNPVEEVTSATTAIWAGPDPTADVSLLAKRDNVCHITTSGSQGCDWDPYNGKRRTTIEPGMTFGVHCYITNGSPVGSSGYQRWDYIPGWGCWVSAKWTNSGCESKFLCT